MSILLWQYITVSVGIKKSTYNADHFSSCAYYLIYLTLHWPFLNNLLLCSLSINSNEYSCHTILAGLFYALFIWLIYGKVAQWLRFRAMNHAIMGLSPPKNVFFHVFLLNHLFCWFLHVFTYLKLFKITTMHVHLPSYLKIFKRYNYTADTSLYHTVTYLDCRETRACFSHFSFI